MLTIRLVVHLARFSRDLQLFVAVGNEPIVGRFLLRNISFRRSASMELEKGG